MRIAANSVRKSLGPATAQSMLNMRVVVCDVFWSLRNPSASPLFGKIMSKIRREKDYIRLSDMPMWDSPIMIAERSAVPMEPSAKGGESVKLDPSFMRLERHDNGKAECGTVPVELWTVPVVLGTVPAGCGMAGCLWRMRRGGVRGRL